MLLLLNWSAWQSEKSLLREILPAKNMEPVDVMWLKTINRGIRGFSHFHFQLYYIYIIIVGVKHGKLSCSTKTAGISTDGNVSKAIIADVAEFLFWRITVSRYFCSVSSFSRRTFER